MKKEWDANERKAKKAIGAAAKEEAAGNKGTTGRGNAKPTTMEQVQQALALGG